MTPDFDQASKGVTSRKGYKMILNQSILMVLYQMYKPALFVIEPHTRVQPRRRLHTTVLNVHQACKRAGLGGATMRSYAAGV